MFFGSRRAMKSVAAAEAAALAAWRILAVGDRVGAIVFDDADMVVIPPQRSRAQVMRILGAVVEKNHRLGLDRGLTPNPAMLNAAFERAARMAVHDFLVCSIGDGTGVDADTVRLATRITAHNDMLAALVFDPLEAGLPDAGRLVMAEGERQLEVDTSEKALRRRFAEDFRQRLDWIREMSRLRSIPLLPIETGKGVAEQIRDALGQRPAAGR
jgi:uncharacterized protein (DUF58 family)